MFQACIDSEQQTAQVAQALGQVLLPGDSVGLCGGLGAGKTTFTRFLVQTFGGDPAHVSSPSYTLQNEYRIGHGRRLEHWDLYRVNDLPLELYEVPAQGVIRIIEWPERCPSLLPDLQITLTFEVHLDMSRTVTWQGQKADELETVMARVS